MRKNSQLPLPLFFAAFAFFSIFCPAKPAQDSIEFLENRLIEIDKELAGLARINFRYGVGNIGWLSTPSKKPQNSQWAEIALPDNTQFDSVVLVPMLWNAPEEGPVADAFPIAFRIIAGEHGDTIGKVIASRSEKDQFLPRVAPLMIEIPRTNAGWVRVESLQLAKDNRANRSILGFSEIMIFDGDSNVALAQPVKTSSQLGGWGSPAIGAQTLTDGITPYLMNAEGEATNSYLAFFNRELTKPSIIVDLGGSYPIDEIHLHNADASEQIPQIHEVDFGIPFHLTVQGANKRNFSDAVTLLNFQRESVYDVGPILSRNVSGSHCRYVRLLVEKPYQMPAGNYRFSFGLAELIIVSNGKNIALGKTVQCAPPNGVRHENQASLVDGSNHFGQTLSIRTWMEELARRHELEKQRPKVAQAIQKKYSRQKATLRWMSWLIASLVVGLILIVLFDRMLRLRAVLRTRERLAANLHDELSANLQALILLSDMAKANLTNQEKLKNIINRIHRLSVRNRTHTRVLMQRLQTEVVVEDLESEMRRCADRLLSGLEQSLQLDEIHSLQSLPQRKKNDLFLFFQECLINIARHADATAMRAELRTLANQGRLVIQDNGRGMHKVPPSLARRARLFGGKVAITSPAAGGTCITLTFPLRQKPVAKADRTTQEDLHEHHQTSPR